MRRSRDLSKALELRPADIHQLYGIPPSTLCVMCKNPDSEKRLPSKLIIGRKGSRGLRLVNHEQLKAWLARWEIKS